MSAAILSAAEADRTARYIASVQTGTGEIPWFAGGHTDPWDHVEAAMALDVQGMHARAAAAYDWLRRNQRTDGSWCREYRRGVPSDRATESNFNAYLAVGLWHHFLSTADRGLLRRLWPTLEAAVGHVLDLQRPDGAVVWARSATGHAAEEALITGCSSIYHSLRCALAIAAEMGELRPEWELGALRLRHALAAHPDRFSPRSRFSMDWYYPVLAGVLTGPDAAGRLTAGWDRFVVPGLGIRCVSDRPWVTGAETAELVLALGVAGREDDAAGLLRSIGHLRDDEGAYWTGYVWPDDAVWPRERTTWTAGAVLLADAFLRGDPATRAVFTGSALPPVSGETCRPDCVASPV